MMKFDKNITLSELCSLAPRVLRLYIEACKDTPQNPLWHPEGKNDPVPHNVYAHINIVFNRAREYGDKDMMMAAFLHDLGKASSTVLNNKGMWSSPMHEVVSARLTSRYEQWIRDFDLDYDRVYNIVAGHMRIKMEDKMRDAKKEKLRSGKYYKDLILFTTFDDMSEFRDSE